MPLKKKDDYIPIKCEGWNGKFVYPPGGTNNVSKVRRYNNNITDTSNFYGCSSEPIILPTTWDGTFAKGGETYIQPERNFSDPRDYAEAARFRQRDWNVTSNIVDYVIQNKRQYDEVISNFEEQIENYKKVYEQELKILDYQMNLVESKVREIKENINPLELLNVVSKHCVQKFRRYIPTAANIRESFSNCVSWASNNGLNTFLTPCATTLTNLQNFYTNKLRTLLEDCSKKLSISHSNHSQCILAVIGEANAFTTVNRKAFSDQMQQAKCSITHRIRATLDCHFTSSFQIISALGKTTSSIQDCMEAIDMCPPCIDNSKKTFE